MINEDKALKLLNEVSLYKCENVDTAPHKDLCVAFRRAIEQHEAFRQEVSDVASVCAQHFCENSWTVGDRQDHVDMLSRFIISAPKPDPLVAALDGVTFDHYPPNDAKTIRAALDKLGFEIRKKNDV